MKVLIIPDKFKGSLTGLEVIRAIEQGVRNFDDSIETHSISASDGGDGFLDAVRKSKAGISSIACDTTDPLGRPIDSEYGYDENNRSAYIEMAKASGMELLTAVERNPERTSTSGTGILISDAIGRGATDLYVGLGGSATNDGGIGIAHALGYRFLDAEENELPPIGGSLPKIETIDRQSVLPELSHVRVHAINDVANPLLGAEGAAAVYAPQKGADAEMVTRLDQGLDRLQTVVTRDLGIDVSEIAGTGAAGGTGYGLKVFCNATFLSGIEFVLSLTGIESLLSSGQIDRIITGEGRIDDQTGYGKLVRGVAKEGAKYDVPVVALCGQLALDHKTVADLGLQRVIELHDPSNSVDYTIKHAKDLLVDAARRILDLAE